MMTRISEIKKERLCKLLYSKECFHHAKRIRFQQLPLEISEMIHYRRDVNDLELDTESVSKILGFGMSTEQDTALDVAVELSPKSAILTPSLMKLIWQKPSLLNIFEVALLLCHRSPLVYTMLNETYLRGNKRIAWTVVKAEPLFYHVLDPEMKKDLDLVLYCLQNSISGVIEHIPDSLKTDRSAALSMVKMNGLVLPYLPAIFRSDKEIVDAALKENANRLGLCFCFRLI